MAGVGGNSSLNVGCRAELSRFWSEPFGLDHGTRKNRYTLRASIGEGS